MKNRINKNTLVNTKSYYNEQQIVRVLDSYVISKGLRYLIDGNELVTSLFQSKSNLMSISKEAGILVRADGEIYLNKSSSSISICGLVDHMSLAVSLGGYSAITHDLKIALEQVLENKEKITKHTVIFPYQITAIHWVLGEIQLNFDKNTHNLITANLNIYNSLKSEKNTIQGHVKKEISDLIKNLFACPELELIIDLIFTGQQDDVFSCGAIGAENGKGIIDGDIQSKLKINYHSDNATLLRIRHIREVNCERFDDMQLADEQWQNPEFQADQSYLKKIISALEKSKLDIAEILQKHDAISFGKFIKSSKGKIGDNEDILFSLLFKNEAGEWHDDALNTLWLACQHLAKRNEVNTEKDDSIGRVGDNRLKVTSITSDHNIDGNKIKKVEVSLQNVKKQDFMGSEILYKKGSVDAVFLKQENLVEETKPKSQHKEIEKEKQEINQGEQAFNAKLKYSDTALKGWFCRIKVYLLYCDFIILSYCHMSIIRKAFRRLHYPIDVIALCVRWYLSYSLSLRNIEEMMAERGTAKLYKV